MATNAFDDLSIPALEGADAVHDLHVAQAETPPVSVPTGPASVRTVVEVGADLTLTLPPDATIDQPRTNGADLEFVQPDGSVIVVPGGAITGLVIVIGDTSIPAEAVATIFAANNIETAAGPEAAAVVGSSGGNFATPVPGIGDGLPLIDLLGNTDFGLPSPDLEDIEDGFAFRTASLDDNEPRADDTSPRAEDGSVLLFDDEGQYDGRTGGIGDADGAETSFSGNLDFDYGFDGRGAGGIKFDISAFQVLNSKGEALADPLTGLQARVFDGVAWQTVDITVSLSADGRTLTGTYANGAETAFIVEILDEDTGAYSITMLAALVHPFNTDPSGVIPGSAFEDELNFSVGYVVTDSNGTKATASLQFGVDDDMPEVSITRGTETIGGGEGDEGGQTHIPISLDLINLDETTGPDVYSSADPLSHDNDGATDDVGGNTMPDPTGTAPFGSQVSTTSLGSVASLFDVTVKYGADGPLDETKGGPSSVTNSVGFDLVDLGDDDNGVATSLSVTQPALGGNPDSNTGDANAYTPYGDARIYLVQVSATEIWGLVGPAVASGDGYANDVAIKLRVVFSDPSDLSTAQIVVEQFMAIDHGDDGNAFDTSAFLTILEGEGSLGLTLTTTAIDGDGDAVTSDPLTVTLIDDAQTFVSIDDDGPVALPVGERQGALFTVDEDGLAGANLDNPAPDGETAGTNLATDTVQLADLKSYFDFGTDGMRSISLAEISEEAALDSGFKSSQQTIYIVSNGVTLRGYTTDGVTQHDVFTLVHNADGSMTFTLLDQIDHHPAGSADNVEAFLKTPLDLSAFIIGTDGDGDSVAMKGGVFTVQILDDIPRISAIEADSTSTSTQPITYTIKAGNTETTTALGGQYGLDIKLTGEDLNDDDDTVNTNNTKIGVGDGNTIDGFDSNDKPGETKHPDTGPEILTLDFLKDVNLANNTDGGRYDVSSVSFRLDISPAGAGAATAVLFIGAAHGSTFQPVSVTINGVSVTGTPVFDSATQVGVVFGGVPDVTGGVQVVVTGTLDQLQIGNFNDYAFSSTNGAHQPLTDGNSFKVFDVRSTALVTTTTTTLADLRHDETAGTALSPPNAADDTANPGIPALSGAFGWAMSATSAATFFTIKVGADEPGSISYAVVNDKGAAFDADPSGLKTTDGRDIVLTTEDGILVGYAVNAGDIPDSVAFKVLVTATGEIWIGQYLPIQHPTGGATAAAFDEIAELGARLHLSATVTDQDGDAATALSDIGIRVTFQDDGPLAVADTNSIAEGDTSISGNVVTGSDTLGADGAAVGGPVVGVTSATGNSDTSPVGDFVVAGRYGTLRLHADGSYTYTLDNANAAVAGLRPGQSLNNEIFTYDIADGDGDRASTTLSIRIDGTDDGVTISNLGATGGDETVYENDLEDGTSPSAGNLTQTGSFTVTAADGFDDLTVAGEPVIANGAGVGLNVGIPTAYGTITITSVNLSTGVVAYSYTLTDNAPHPVSGADALFDDIAVLASDTDGDTAPATLSIKVVDDVPVAENDQPVQTTENDPVIIDVLANDKPGADGLQSVTLVAPYAGPGTLTQNGGVFTFTPAPGQQGTVTFQYILTDGDADTDPATVTITLREDSVPTVSVQSGTVDEKGLATGSGETIDPLPDTDTTETATGTFTISTGGDALTRLEVQDKFGAWQDVTNGGPVAGDFGTLTVIKTGNSYSWSYTLAGNAAHPDDSKIGAADQLTDAFATRVTDSDGDSTDTVISASETITISINDDGPVAVNDIVATPVAEDGSVLIDVFANDRAGADGVNLVTGLTIVTGPAHGTLVYNANGTFTYTAAAGAEGPDSFTYQLKDGDGDLSTATVSLTIAADSTPQISVSKNAALDEDGLGTANADNGLATETDGGGLYQDTGTIVVDFGKDQPTDLLAAFKFQTTGLNDEIDALGDNVTWALSGNDRTLTGSANGIPVVTITIIDASSNGAGVVTYTYQATLLQPVTHPADDEDAVSITGIPFTVTDKDSDTRSGSFAVAITDDVPELLVSNTPSSATEAGDAVVGTWSLSAGADGVTTVTVTFGSISGELSLSPGSSLTLVEPTGTLTVAADHSWSFTAAANQNNAANPQATFTLAAADGDGDETSDTQVVSITDGAGPTTSVTPTSLTVDEKAVETTHATGSAEIGLADNASPLEADSKGITFTAGSDNIVSVSFGDPSGITVDSNMDAVADIIWEPAGSDLVGKIDGVIAITLSLSGFATIAAGQNGSVTVAATLSDNFPHLFGPNGPNSVVLNGITVVARDTDGTPATANVTVTVFDDVPQIAVDSTGPSTVAELGTLNGTWSLNPGADGVPNGVMVSIDGAGYVAVNPGPFVIDGKGTLSFGAGTWSFVAASGIDNTVPQSLSFTLKAIDADGDETTDTQSVTITDGTGPSTPVGTTGLLVNEEGLDTANAHGSINNSSENAIAAISFTAGTDAITSFAFGSTSGIEVFINDDATPDIAWSIDSGTGNLVGKIDNIVAVTLTLSGAGIAAGATGTVTVAATLSDNFPHIAANGENAVTLTGITVVAKDTDNSTATANVSLTVVDDVPGTIAAEPAAIVEDEQFSSATDENTDSTPDYTAVATGDIRDNGVWGADGFGRVTQFQLGANAVVTVAAGGQSTVYFGKTGAYLGTDSTGAAASVVVNSNGTYTFTLLGNLLINSGQGELLDTLGTLTLTATDTDGDPATVTVDLQVKDDVPLAVSGVAMTVAETAGATNGDALLGNDLLGADGASVTHVDLHDGNGFVLITGGVPSGNGYTFTKAGIGTYTFHADGAWSLDPVVNASTTDQDGSFHYRITDGDGDVSEALQTVTVTNANNQPSATAVTAVVDDEGLPHGIIGGATDASTEKAYAQGAMGGSGGDGALVYSFANGSGAVGQETVNYGWDSIANRLTAKIVDGPIAGRVGTTLFSVDISASGDYTVHLFRPVLHATGNAENNETLALSYTVADSDGIVIGDTATSTLTIDFDDDAPKAFAAQSMTIENGANAIGSGALNFYESIGADGGNVVFTGTNGSNLTSTTGNVTSGGKIVHLYGFGTDTLTGKIDLDGNAANGDETTVFTVKLQPSATDENADSYVVQFERALDDGSQVTLNPTALGFSSAGNPRFNTIDRAGSDLDLLISGGIRAAGGIGADTVNTNASSLGVSAGQAINDNDVARFDFVSSPTVNGTSANTQTYNYGAHYLVNSFSFDIQSASGSPEIWIRAYKAPDNDPAAGTSTSTALATSHSNALTGTGSLATITGILVNGVAVNLTSLQQAGGGYLLTGLATSDVVQIIAADGFSRIELENPGSAFTSFTPPEGQTEAAFIDSDDYKLGAFTYGTLSGGAGSPLNLNFNVTATDADGDTAAGTIAIKTVPPSLTPTGATAGDDLLASGSGGETLGGLAGSDTLIGGVGADTLDGGDNTDTVSYQNSAVGVTVDLTLVGTAQTSSGDANGDKISNVENVIGSAFDDILAGDGNANVLIGLDGVDTLKGGGGADKLFGGLGDDFLDGEGGIDFLSGGLGNDTLTGGAGSADTFAFAEFGSDNRDTINDYLATEGDKVDLSAILDSVFAPGSDVTKFLHVATDGTNTTVQVDTTGTGTFNSAGDVAVLNGVHGGDTITFIFDGTDHTVNVI